eukprot:1920075-Rhodomonas_salina.6
MIPNTTPKHTPTLSHASTPETRCAESDILHASGRICGWNLPRIHLLLPQNLLAQSRTLAFSSSQSLS